MNCYTLTLDERSEELPLRELNYSNDEKKVIERSEIHTGIEKSPDSLLGGSIITPPRRRQRQRDKVQNDLSQLRFHTQQLHSCY
ncbi:hypothetical protein CCP3SC15_4270001 [Gammaproteobacteria bacterium]